MQPTFFDDSRSDSVPQWERDDSERVFIAQVVLPEGPDNVFDYRIPERLIDRIQPGMRLKVPFGKSNRPLTVYCIRVMTKEWGGRAEDQEKPSSRKFVLKEVIDLVDAQPLLSPKMLELTRWISDYYLCPLGQTLEAVLPAGVRDYAGTRLTTVYSLVPDAAERIRQINSIGEGQHIGLLTRKQIYVLDVLRDAAEPMTLSELARAAKCSMVPVNALKKLGLFQARRVRRHSAFWNQCSDCHSGDASLSRETAADQRLELNPDQNRALSRILAALRAEESPTFLLHGVTGSGKTEIYIRAIEEVVGYGKEAIVLVPEISLTPQTVHRFQERFGEVAVLHSHLTDAERHCEWMKISSGKIRVVVGARSAIFAPLPHPGLIVIDEEHENSFKQDVAPRYHAREVARMRATQEKIPLILGSATPSLESWHRQIKGEYQLLSLPRRVKNRPLPMVQTVDLRSKEVYGFTRGAIHQQMNLAIREALDEDGQIILFLNRRGFSTHIQCPSCGEVLRCPDCDVPLTYHQTGRIAICHYCDYQIPAPERCPKCGFAAIRYSGFGTQKLEQELQARYPDVPILRMDADTMQGHGAHERALSVFRSGRFRILLGTQMIAKGLDFPNVTLVGVINADTSLHLPDFRAAERTFHLITQVAGRTGRGEKGGRVIVQTYCPDHPAIMAAMKHDYDDFVRTELPQRRLWGYPPYSAMFRFIIRGPVESQTLEFAQLLKDQLFEIFQKMTEQGPPDPSVGFRFRLVGPAPAPFAKLRGNYRFHIHLHGNDTRILHHGVREMLNRRLKTPPDVQWIVDVDPIDML